MSCPGGSTCNGNGRCDLTTGFCICIPGFEGTLENLNKLCDNMISYANGSCTEIKCSADLDNEWANESE